MTVLVGGGRGAGWWVVLGVGCLVPVGFFLARGFVRWSGWGVVAAGALVQAVGVIGVTGRVVLGVPSLVAGGLGVVLVVRAWRVLVDAPDGAAAGTSLVVRSRARAVKGAAGWKPVLATASMDGTWLRWRVGDDGHAGKVLLREIGAVWVAQAAGAEKRSDAVGHGAGAEKRSDAVGQGAGPHGGPVVAVRAGERVVRFVVGDPEGFAWLLDRRVRAFRATSGPP